MKAPFLVLITNCFGFFSQVIILSFALFSDYTDTTQHIVVFYLVLSLSFYICQIVPFIAYVKEINKTIEQLQKRQDSLLL